MHSNPIYRAFLVALVLITLWYSFSAVYRYYNYAQLTAQTPLTTSEWLVHQVAEDEFYLEANYTFTLAKKTYEGRTSWPRQFYRNHWAAEKDIPYFKKNHTNVWFNPNNPHHSSLQKSFPLKECISAALLWGILLYFIWMGFYVNKFKP